MARRSLLIAAGLAVLTVLMANGAVLRPANSVVIQRATPTPSPSIVREGSNIWSQPHLQLPGLDGQTRQLSEWKGKVLIVNFWAGWCGPCQFEIPHFVRWQKQFGAQGLQIVSVGVDKVRSLKNVARST